jgi:hypothetical protein
LDASIFTSCWFLFFYSPHFNFLELFLSLLEGFLLLFYDQITDADKAALSGAFYKLMRAVVPRNTDDNRVFEQVFSVMFCLCFWLTNLA